MRSQLDEVNVKDFLLILIYLSHSLLQLMLMKCLIKIDTPHFPNCFSISFELLHILNVHLCLRMYSNDTQNQH